MSEKPNADEVFFKQLSVYLQGNESAIDFCWMLNYICHLWDDLIDKDKERSDSDINKCFRLLFLSLPQNCFYRAHEAVLQPLIHSTILQYQTANILERGENMAGKYAAYAMRNDMLNIFAMCIYLVGGQVAYDTFAAEFYTFCAEGLIEEFPVFKAEFMEVKE